MRGITLDSEATEPRRQIKTTRSTQYATCAGPELNSSGSNKVVSECARVKNDKPALKRLLDLPENCWSEAPQDCSGIQYFTEGRVGLSTHSFMLDGGSGVNSTTEELVLKVINENQAAGISLKDKRHPIKLIERWKHQEALRGVAGNANVPLLGAVVVAVNLLEIGKQDGPEIRIRFKVCKAGSTDWVGWILGARCIDCPANGGLGFIPLEHSHSFTALGIQTERTERPGGMKPDSCYAVISSAIDSESDEELHPTGAAAAAPAGSEVRQGTPLLYEGDPSVLQQGEGAWIPVVAASSSRNDVYPGPLCAFPCAGAPVEAVPGIWDESDATGMLCVISLNEFDTVLEPGMKVGELHPAAIQTRVCQGCGCQDTDAWIADSSMPKCIDCGVIKVAGPSSCRQCGAGPADCCVLSYAGCGSCRPEAGLKGKVRRGPAAGFLARSALAFTLLLSQQCLQQSQPCAPRLEPAAGAVQEQVKLHPVFHIIEEPGGIKHLTECEVPTEEYNAARVADLAARHPNVSPGLIEHLEAFEPFLDTSILAGFSYGVNKADVIAIEASLLGHKVGREGSKHDPEKTDAIENFAPLKDVTQVRQFVGSTNWVRRYLLPCYATAVKILGEYMKPAAVFPADGLGSGDTPGCKAVKCIKLLCKHAIQLSTMDEASAIDGSRPLEQIADACGIAWGSTNVQMTPDLTGFKVLMMTGKGFTPAQQAWAAITLEGFAQLGGKRAQKKILGPMRSLNWTDHANMTKQQQIELVDIDIKLLRWVSEIVADGSEIRSLAGRSARLGDGTSRNPKDRDILMEQRTKDLAGMIGQVRGFDLDEFLSDWEPQGEALPWAVGDGGWVKSTSQQLRVPCLEPVASAGVEPGRTRFHKVSLESATRKSTLASVMSGEGISPVLKVLYVPDYVPMQQRIAVTSKLYVQLSQLLPSYQVHLAVGLSERDLHRLSKSELLKSTSMFP